VSSESREKHALAGLRLGLLAFDALPEAMKEKPVLIKSLNNGKLKWDDLPQSYFVDVDYLIFIAPLVKRSQVLCSMAIVVVEDKTAMLEWVLSDEALADWIPDDYWLGTNLPQGVGKCDDTLLRIVTKVPRGVRCMDKSMHTPQFIRRLLRAQPLVLKHLPDLPKLDTIVWTESNMKAFIDQGEDTRRLTRLVPLRRLNKFWSSLAVVRAGGYITEDIPHSLWTKKNWSLSLLAPILSTIISSDRGLKTCHGDSKSR